MKEQILAAMDMLVDALEELDSHVVDTATPAAPTPAEISESVSGNPTLYLDNPVQYGQMKKFYNPLKEPFTNDNWMTTLMMGYGTARDKDGYLRDPRPYKTVEVDGKPYRRTAPAHGPDFYWIGKGVSDLTQPEWNAMEIDNTLTYEQRLENIRNYKGGLRTSLAGWPEKEREAYLSTHGGQ